MTDILGVIVIARNGDRTTFYQDPNTYASGDTTTTALGEVHAFQLGASLRNIYLNAGSMSFISGISVDIADTQQVKVRAKAGGEGAVVFDSASALLQGLFPPASRNKITLANGEVVTAPLGGYQYVPMETVEPGNDRSMESWTDCPAFQKHIAAFHSSDAFIARANDAAQFFNNVKNLNLASGLPAILENIVRLSLTSPLLPTNTLFMSQWNIYDFMNTQLIYNQSYASQVQATYITQARALADFHENGIFSDTAAGGVGNIAAQTMLPNIITSLMGIASNENALKFSLFETTYQSFISLFNMTEITDQAPELKAIPDFASALAIEVRRGSLLDPNNVLRFKFKNGTADNWTLVYPFGQQADTPLAEFIYRAEGSAITSNKQWAQVCGASSQAQIVSPIAKLLPRTPIHSAETNIVQIGIGAMLFFVLSAIGSLVVRKRLGAKKYGCLLEDDFETVQKGQKAGSS
ncbi:histidine phosphatase superfamily [Mycena polygramma]|nr:histidine phosphatase superfamily [Mycena polygramma]